MEKALIITLLIISKVFIKSRYQIKWRRREYQMVQKKKSMTDINEKILNLSTQDQNLSSTQNPNVFHYSGQLYCHFSHHPTRTTGNDTKAQHISEALLECKRVYDASKSQIKCAISIFCCSWLWNLSCAAISCFFYNQLHTLGLALYWGNYCWSTTSFLF